MQIETDEILDWFYSALDNALCENNFSFVNNALRYTEVESTSTDILLALLIHSRLIHSPLLQDREISHRKEFYQKCEVEFKKRNPENWKQLLEGLKV